MSAFIVLGAQWGDEGKGKVTDYLAQKQMLYVVMLEVTMQVIPLFMVVRNLL